MNTYHLNNDLNKNALTVLHSENISTIVMLEKLVASCVVDFIQGVTQLSQQQILPNTIVLDFSLTKFIDSSGIGALVKAYQLLKSKNVKLEVTGVNENIMSVLVMTGLDKLLSNNKQQENNKPHKIEKQATHPSILSKTKRFVDIIGSIVGLCITAIFLIPIALAIKIESPGPLIFSQKRVGWMSRRFKIYKFRTMVSDAESRKHEVNNEASGAIFKCKNDHRITRVGQFLRKMSLDELPQFWNVLEGSMSLVGTRPPTQDELEQYNVPHWQRLDVKPGITGEWQVNGRSSVKNFEDIIQLDLDYQKKWSLWYDIKLMFKTIGVIFSKESGAM